jgi:hypothetical protein
MTLLLVIVLVLLLAGGGGIGAWRAPAYRSEWIGMVAILIVLLLVFYAIAPGGRLVRYDAPPAATVR